jgi:hypothetical protein
VPPHGLPDQDSCSHADAEYRAEQEEQDVVRVRDAGQCFLAEEATDPHGIHGAVERLQHVATEDRQRKQKQRGGNRSLREIAAFHVDGVR